MASENRGSGYQQAEAPTPDEIAKVSLPLKALIARVGEVVVGQEGMVRGLIIGMLTGGHVLLEGVPGLAKTLTVSTLSHAIDATFKRVQFTPDLLPADLTGTLIYSPRDGTFSARKGPVFANIVLADEINRAPAKVQSALLEAMQERRVTIGDETYTLPDPFLVLATQNPIEQEGTYPLPEAQVDRFMLKIKVGYPTREQERIVLDRMAHTRHAPQAPATIALREIAAARDLCDRVHIDPRIRDYIVDVVHATRRPEEYKVDIAPGAIAQSPRQRGKSGSTADNAPASQRLIDYGASPRGTICLALAAKASALLEGRSFVTPQDVKAIAAPVLRHRIIVSYEAEAQDITSEQVVQRVLETLAVP